MKARLIAIGIFFLLCAPFVSAQNTQPSPNNDACWQSLSALRACQLAEYNREMDYAARCTSYPEYQCLPADTGAVTNPETAATGSKKRSKTNAAASKYTDSQQQLVPVSGK